MIGFIVPRSYFTVNYWRRSQVVRQRSAKPLFIGSIPIAASIKPTTYGQPIGCLLSFGLPMVCQSLGRPLFLAAFVIKQLF
jgi:hypothetical protein